MCSLPRVRSEELSHMRCLFACRCWRLRGAAAAIDDYCVATIDDYGTLT